MSPARPSFQLGDIEVRAGKSKIGELPVAALVTGTAASLPIQIAHGRRPGPTVWLSAAVHGDEINGVEIIRRVMSTLKPAAMAGTVIAAPIVNLYGFLNESRYLPDRRDLNRSFPGSPRGSLAARLAHIFLNEIVDRCSVGIDFHTGSDNRSNWPQIRADLDDPTTHGLAQAFAAPIMVHASLRDGSLRQSARDRGARVLLFEGGENSRFDPAAIAVGTRGALRALQHLDVLPELPEGTGLYEPSPVDDPSDPEPAVSLSSRRTGWVRARRSGILWMHAQLGQRVTQGEEMGVIHDALGKRLSRVMAGVDGVVIGRVELPLVTQGDALVHVAQLDTLDADTARPNTALLDTAKHLRK